jgi:hypothetical protein
MREKLLSQHVKEMKALGELLAPVTHANDSVGDAFELAPLRCRKMFVDGYYLVVSYATGDDSGFRIETLQMQGVSMPYLPFYLVCKLAKAFLGPKKLGFMDFIQDGKKIYCWSVRSDSRGKRLPLPKDYKRIQFENFKFALMADRTVNLST